MMSKIKDKNKLIIFDIGGVLAEDVWENLLLDKTEGLLSICNLPEDNIKEVGRELWKEFSCRITKQEDNWHKQEEEYWELLTRRLNVNKPIKLFIDMTDKFIRPIEGMMSLVQELHNEGLKLGICSNNNEFWFQRQAKKLELGKFFKNENIVLSCRIGYEKSSSGFEMFGKVIEVTGLEKSNCVFIDDRKENIRMALDFGMIGILFPSKISWGAQYLKTLIY
jgi:HAD superfamily hydrolase (TIGR01509 family)